MIAIISGEILFSCFLLFIILYKSLLTLTDISLSVLTGAFSQALFQNHSEVDIVDVYNAIKTSKRIYPDSIVKELAAFREKFENFCEDENIVLPVVTIDQIQNGNDIY